MADKTCELVDCGHRACGGCGPAFAARMILKGSGPNSIVCASTGCMEVFSTPYPQTAWKVPWIHSLFENAAAVASGVESALRKLGRDEHVLCICGDGATFDIGIQCISGAFERGHNITYVCYDNEAYMNTGIQRSGATPYDANTTTSPAGKRSTGNNRPKKDLPRILAAHGSPYVATCSIAYPADIIKKVDRAVQTEGPCYIQIHTPCCTGWGFDGSKTVEIAKMAVNCGLWVNYELVGGTLEKAKKIKRQPVDEYLRSQKRFAHLFRPERNEAEIAKIQAIADANAVRYGIDL